LPNYAAKLFNDLSSKPMTEIKGGEASSVWVTDKSRMLLKLGKKCTIDVRVNNHWEESE